MLLAKKITHITHTEHTSAPTTPKAGHIIFMEATTMPGFSRPESPPAARTTIHNLPNPAAPVEPVSKNGKDEPPPVRAVFLQRFVRVWTNFIRRTVTHTYTQPNLPSEPSPTHSFTPPISPSPFSPTPPLPAPSSTSSANRRKVWNQFATQYALVFLNN